MSVKRELNIAVCDDEAVHRDIVRDMLLNLTQSYGTAYSVHEFCGVDRLLATSMNYDIIILDVKLGNADGIETGVRLRRQGCCCPIIFMSMLEERAVDGYKANGFRYLVKPLVTKQFEEAILSAQSILQEQSGRLSVKCSDGNHLLWVDKIIFIESYLHTARIVTTEKETYTKTPLYKLREALPSEKFGAPHKSFLVSFNYVMRFDSKNVEMSNGIFIPISFSRREVFGRDCMKYLRGLRP